MYKIIKDSTNCHWLLVVDTTLCHSSQNTNRYNGIPIDAITAKINISTADCQDSLSENPVCNQTGSIEDTILLRDLLPNSGRYFPNETLLYPNQIEMIGDVKTKGKSRAEILSLINKLLSCSCKCAESQA